jgi:thiol-disulfide isomerase/thioredoxin
MSLPLNINRRFSLKLYSLILGFLLHGFFSSSVIAEEYFQPFKQGSYQNILKRYSTNNLLVVFWSIDCPPCIKELKHLGEFHLQNPDRQITLINIDTGYNQKKLLALLEENHLANIERWIFNSNHHEKLRYEIDPRWLGDLPRSYFFSLTKKPQRLRGVLSLARIEKLFKEEV